MCSVSCCPTQRKGKATSYPWKRFSLRVRSWRGEACLRSTWSGLGRPNWRPCEKPCTTARSTDTWTSPSTSGASVSFNRIILSLVDAISSFERIYIHISFTPQGSPGLYTLGWSLCERVSVSTADLWSRVSWRSSAASRKRSTPRSWSRTACPSCFRSSGPARYETGACSRVELRGSFVLRLLLNSSDWDVWSALWQKLVWCHRCGGETGQRSHLGAVSPHRTVTRGRNRAVICWRIKEHQIKEEKTY